MILVNINFPRTKSCINQVVATSWCTRQFFGNKNRRHCFTNVANNDFRFYNCLPRSWSFWISFVMLLAHIMNSLFFLIVLFSSMNYQIFLWSHNITPLDIKFSVEAYQMCISFIFFYFKFCFCLLSFLFYFILLFFFVIVICLSLIFLCLHLCV